MDGWLRATPRWHGYLGGGAQAAAGLAFAWACGQAAVADFAAQAPAAPDPVVLAALGLTALALALPDDARRRLAADPVAACALLAGGVAVALGRTPAAASGHVAALATTLFGLGAAVALQLGGRRPGRRAAAWLAAWALVLPYSAAVGSLLATSATTGLGAALGMPPATAGLALLVGAAVLARDPDAAFARYLAAATPSGMLCRRLIPVLLAVPPLVGWLRLYLEGAGWLDHVGGVTFMTLAITVVGLAAIAFGALAVDRLEARRHQLDEDLLASESYAAALLEGAPDALLVADAGGTIVQANAQAEHLFGSDRPTLRGMTLDRLLPAGDGDRLAVRLDGQAIHVEIGRSAIGSGADRRTLVAIRDVSARKATEAALQASEQRLRTILGTIPVAVAVFDRDMRYLVASEAWRLENRLGDIPLAGRSAYALHPELPERWRRLHQDGLAGVASHAAEERFERPGGRVAYFTWSIAPWRDTDGRIGGIITCTEDVTARVLVTQALARSQDRLAEAQAIAAIGSWEWDLQRDEVSLSDEAYRLLGRDPARGAPTYETWLAGVHPDDRAAADAAVRAARSAGTSFDFECRVVRPDGTLRVHHQRGRVDLAPDGTPAMLRATSQDVTEQRELERRLREQFEHLVELRHRQQLEHLRNAFMDGVSHELKTPLAIIMGYAELLEDQAGGPLPPEALEMVGAVQRGARRLEGLLNDLIDVVRMEAGTFMLERGEVDLRDLVGRCVAHAGPQAAHAGLVLDLRLPATALLVHADPRRLEQVLCHLFTNAFKFTPHGGRVVVEAVGNEREVRCAVRNEGEGLAPEDLALLFERFKQVGAGERQGKGLGLGLYVSKLLVEAHGGRIGAESSPGRGATFWFTLPTGIAAPEPAPAAGLEAVRQEAV